MHTLSHFILFVNFLFYFTFLILYVSQQSTPKSNPNPTLAITTFTDADFFPNTYGIVYMCASVSTRWQQFEDKLYFGKLDIQASYNGLFMLNSGTFLYEMGSVTMAALSVIPNYVNVTDFYTSSLAFPVRSGPLTFSTFFPEPNLTTDVVFLCYDF